jgi:phospholipase C
LFESVRSWSWPAHLDLASEWVATCTDYSKASTCTTTPDAILPHADTQLPWVNLFQLLDRKHVSWKYYLEGGAQPDCPDGSTSCEPQAQSPGVPSIWNPAPYFAWVKTRGAAYLRNHNPPVEQFLRDVQNGALPQVSWIVPEDADSEHPPFGVTRGMEFVTSMVNAVMQSPYWADTAIFIAWDDWGGFYDHAVPPNVDRNSSSTPIQGFGIRVPGIMVSAYAKPGMIDHAVLSFNSYATFIEDLFMGGARLDPARMGNPDSRPDVRDALTEVTFPDGTKTPMGNLMDEFDFTQAPLPPLVLSTLIPTGILARCSAEYGAQCTTPTVTISWTRVKGASKLTYHIQRDGTELPQCAGTAATCIDQPGSGAHLYRAYSVDSTGISSPLSAAAEADVP